MYEEVTYSNNNYVLVHAGLSNFSRTRRLSDYGLEELIFIKPDYDKLYFEDKILETGHTTTRLINKDKKDRIFIANNNIAVDCGNGYDGLQCIYRLNDNKAFYI